MTIKKQLVSFILLSVLLIPLFFSCSTYAKKNSSTYAERIDWIAKIAQEYAGFSGTILVGNNSEIIYHKSLGFADKEKQESLSPAHRFSPGSIDKEFTTVAIMLLKQQGKLSYDDKISEYLLDLPGWANQITINHILTHTSGLPDIRYGRNLTTDDAIQQLMSIEKLKYKPGERYYYGNLHSVLRAMVIEKVSGQPHDIFIQENIFSPAGMDQAFCRTSLDKNQPLVAYGSRPMAVAGIDMYLTAQDLYRWEKALWNGNIVNLKALKEGLAPNEMNAKSNWAKFDFGYTIKNEKGEISEVVHDGTHPSHYAQQSINFNSGLIVIILSNDGKKSTVSSLHQKIRELEDSSTVQIPSAWWFTHEAKVHGYLTAIETFKANIKSGERAKPKEFMLNSLGYDLNEDNSGEDALLVLKLNLEFYPNSANAYDSYADILLEAGKYEEAKNIAELGLKIAKESGDDFLIRSMNSYLEKIKIKHSGK